MFYTVYKTTNLVNGKIYIGSHKTKDLNDRYLGSGKYLNHAIKKHGVENFKKEILFVFDTPKEMYDKEAELVNVGFLAEENTYNLKIGGFGGFDHLNDSSTAHIERCIKAHKSRKSGYTGWKLTVSQQQRISKQGVSARYEQLPNGATFLGKHHTEETKKMMSEKAKSRLVDKTKHSQYNTMWITNGEENRKISKNSDLPDGWYKGRVNAKGTTKQEAINLE